jgi:FkbM family methyltransferase
VELNRRVARVLSKLNTKASFRFVASVVLSLKYKSLVRVRRRNGLWYHYCPDWIRVEREIHTSRLDFIDSVTEDTWLYNYRPQRGDVIIDVGAGTGSETYYFSRYVGENGRVIAIEAHPETFRCLQEMVIANRLKNVVCINAAVSDKRKPLFISDSPNHITNSVSETEGIQIQGITIDDIVREHALGKIDFIKMNIEGAERLALDGMSVALPMTRNVAIGCHDFLAQWTHNDDCRTESMVSARLKDYKFIVDTRSDDKREWIQFTRYGRK